jgi:hypothetical protein
MKWPLLLVSIAGVAALAITGAASAKGPAGATVTGPGITTLVLTGNGEDGTSRLGRLTQAAGFFPAVFGQSPDPMLRVRPNGSLGPRFTVIWSVPGGDGVTSRIRQLVYPYAKPLPLTYMRPGQPFWDGERTYGGWFQAGASLRRVLVAAGLPARPAV